mmetsp:Transcript_28101/g.68433  ORF Transcript_28101/g.68433 Transcript_28101/m.68433 type:complete len:310 (-) Transcript_28101:33-962(-)
MPKIRFRFGIAAASLAFGHAVTVPSGIPITTYRDDYESPSLQPALTDDTVEGFLFHRFQSPSSIQASLESLKKRNPLKKFRGKDGRRGMVSSTKLNGDWVLAESKQVAVNCTVDEVLTAYMSAELQEQWNEKDVIKCTFHQIQYDEDEEDSNAKDSSERRIVPRIPGVRSLHRNDNNDKSGGIIYRQDLVLKSQRVIRSHTGIMRYCQSVTIDKIGQDKYSVLVNLDPHQQGGTAKRPFESLSVYVGLQQAGKNVNIYAAGVMKVNRNVVPNLLIFDASGIAGSMAGKGTLWLAGHFEQRRASTSENRQ